MSKKSVVPQTTLKTRRTFLATSAGLGLGASLPSFAIAQNKPIKVGIMLPYTGVLAKLGENVTEGMLMRLEQVGNKLGGHPIEFSRVDSETSPPKAVDNVSKLVKGEGVDFVIGPVHSGVAMAMTKVMSRAPKTIMICPNAGNNALTREACGSNIFRTSFSNWQMGYPMGKIVHDAGHRRIVTMAWNYAAGHQMIEGFVEGFKEAGGEDPIEQIWPAYGDVEFQASLTKIAALKPDAVMVFFSGTGAVKYASEYDASIDRASIPLYGVGFLTEGTLKAQGKAAEGLVTALHWADTLEFESNARFMKDFTARTGRQTDVFAVQGYDTADVLIQSLAATDGDVENTDALVKAIENVSMDDSPRGPWGMSRHHNPVQDIYAREVRDGVNVVTGSAHKGLTDPGTGCKKL